MASEGSERPEPSVSAIGTKPITTVIGAPAASESIASAARAMSQEARVSMLAEVFAPVVAPGMSTSLFPPRLHGGRSLGNPVGRNPAAGARSRTICLATRRETPRRPREFPGPR